jgi:ribosomal protein S18 acetylase RimI-like enzyme
MDNADIEIREAGIHDVDALATIGSSSFRDAYQEHSNAADLEAHLQRYFIAVAVRSEIEQHARRYLLASVNNQASGIAKFRDAACPVPGGKADAVELQQLYVLAQMQGHGLGRRLVQQLINIAQEKQATGIWLSVWEFADWAVGFYEKNGFSVVGTTDFTLGATTYNDLLMWMSLE